MKYQRICIIAVFCFLGLSNLVTSQASRGRNRGRASNNNQVASQSIRGGNRRVSVNNRASSQTRRNGNRGAAIGNQVSSQTIGDRNSVGAVSNQAPFQTRRDRKRGAYIGQLTSLKHNVQGEVYAVDENTLCIENFHYDGAGGNAYFWVGTSGKGSSSMGIIIKDVAVQKASGQNGIIKMPQGIKIPKNLKWLSVSSRSQSENFGHIVIPRNLDVPQMRVLPGLSPLKHGVRSGNVTIIDSKTISIPNLFYDGLGPDAFFWVGNNPTPDYKGMIINNEKGNKDILAAYNGEDIVLRLPTGLTWYDVTYLSIWCREFRVDFGHVLIPSNLWVPPYLE